MKTAADIVAGKYRELIPRLKGSKKNRLSALTRAERAIWLLVTIRSAIDSDGFESVFDQAVTRNELVEAIGYLREFNLPEIAELFERALLILDTHGFYTKYGNPMTICSDYSDQLREELDTIGKGITKGDVLRHIDDQLVDMLARDNIAPD